MKWAENPETDREGKCVRTVPPYHKVEGVEDINSAIKIECNTNIVSDGGIPYYYSIWGGGMPVNIQFQSKCVRPMPEGREDMDGVTNEALLAILQDRLEHVQKTTFACNENADALAAIKRAQAHLQQRTRRRAAQGLMGKLEETASAQVRETYLTEEHRLNTDIKKGAAVEVKKEDKKEEVKATPRVVKTDDVLSIGLEHVGIKNLDAWKGWQSVESAVKRLVKESGPLNETEMEVIRSCATTAAGKNGLREFESAYAQMR